MTRDSVVQTLLAHRQQLEPFGVRSLSLFGSAAREKMSPDSDIDILVEFAPEAEVGLFRFLELRDLLSDLLGRPVDLVTRDALHPALEPTILEEAVHVA